MIRLGPLARRWKRENTSGYSWVDLNVALLDNYREQLLFDFVTTRLTLPVLLLKPERQSSEMEPGNIIISRVCVVFKNDLLRT